ncbi:GTP-binding protein [Colwelliaceae bacterium 6441]
MNLTKPIRNIGIMAHVDAGKTTLTEQLLFSSGAIRSVGRVDHGTSRTDSLEVERARGITVKSASVALEWNDVVVRIIDTPGHADFYPEVERSIRVLDGAILVLSSVEGIQLQTLNIWNALREVGVPTLIYVNKLDRVGSDPVALLEDMKKQLSENVLPMQVTADYASKSPTITDIHDDQQTLHDAIETLAGVNEDIMQKYVSDELLSKEQLHHAINHHALKAEIFPVYYGIALRGIGVPELLDAIVNYLPAPIGQAENELSSVVFKVEAGHVNGRIAHVRVFEGTINQRDSLPNEITDEQEKINRLLKLDIGGNYQNVSALKAGDIGVICGVQHCKVGHVLGSSYAIPNLPTAVEPMLVARVLPENANQWNDLLEALLQLEDEDPLLNVEWREAQREIHLRFFGEVQMEIIKNMLETRFQLQADFSEPCVIYKQTAAGVGEASIEFRDGGYADLTLRVEPQAAGSGFAYQSLISGDSKIYQKFMKQIPQILEKLCLEGSEGREVTDVKVTLVDGYCKYDLGTQANDYKIVTPIVFERALKQAETTVLEPVMDFHIRVPEIYSAQIYRDLLQMRAKFEPPLPDEGWMKFSGRVPFSETFKYTSVLYASSHGQGVLKTSFCGYFPL